MTNATLSLHEKDQSKMPLEYTTEEGDLRIFGFWIFLAAELVLFGTLFGTYLVLQSHTAGGPTAKDLFEIGPVMAETIILLMSSFTCGLSTIELRRHNKKGLIGWMSVTILLGLVFIGLEANEFYTYAVHEGAPLSRSAFLSGFFVLLGTHGAHVSLGIVWIIGILLQLGKRGITPVTARKAFMAGLYWHFLDVVWIFIFTAVYLTGLVI
ncbi:cytochrome aa3 quinol oxidase subunit III [Sporolactobacillus shoreicorticis]|uniref:Quinol oxidase subunit 3 n=1 Tax=Sporolactobacillus shoreicorticis TaxID=1923877 RepID=A0ABW5S6Z0_9BACL|nr:cytochrome aa3 quinol oxidase subunit III [Sporolactobacillus shoreicorticis]MCO7125502.1 cytochrome aa3 quinol oxidase subunit III [Sporolactobacillus shoreicorticis]